MALLIGLVVLAVLIGIESVIALAAVAGATLATMVLLIGMGISGFPLIVSTILALALFWDGVVSIRSWMQDRGSP
jgi:hypothetical protein